MPILVKDYEWSETKDKVHITVPLKGVKATNVDVLCTDEFLKANYPPFLFEVLLFGRIDDVESNAKVRDGRVEFNLNKLEPGMWNRLISEHSEDKAFMLKKKLEAVEYVQKKTEERSKEMASKKTEQKKYTLNKMMRLEEDDRKRISNEKEAERMRTEDDMERWKSQRRQEEEQERKRLMEVKIEESMQDMHEVRELQSMNPEETGHQKKEIFIDSSEAENSVELAHVDKEKAVLKPRVSKPRQQGKITFKFTPRVFPTPLRESKTDEEEEWLKKQAEARKITDIEDSDLKDHEKDPVWLKDKGNSLFASGNFLAAVNAYNLAIRIQPKNHTLYSNRAACHLKLRNFYKCIEDCTSALDLLQPPVPANANARLKAHIRKGAAFCELELYAEGLMDYMAALEIDPNNERLKKDADRIREIIEKGDTEV